MGSVSDIIANIFSIFDGFVSAGSTAAEGFLTTGSDAANNVYDVISGSIIGE
ncbi:hypothetical protein [Dietzia sp. ANT_WB102]|uniref:hypothetical protein n=1 Tax=Dietzia sp. ANT_WB102 TaxID=2597345 RepID=UPI00165DD00E|nr:hypothetical protein [Dietzia sp. ANT_WB102]